MKTLEEQISVMQHALSGGKVIECRENGSNSSWKKCHSPFWNWHGFDYRVKPEPIVLKGYVHKDDLRAFIRDTDECVTVWSESPTTNHVEVEIVVKEPS